MVYKRRKKKKETQELWLFQWRENGKCYLQSSKKEKKSWLALPFKNHLQPLLREKAVAVKFYIEFILVHVLR